MRVSGVETIYANMPSNGLGAALGVAPVAAGQHSAAARLGAGDDDEPALPAY